MFVNVKLKHERESYNLDHNHNYNHINKVLDLTRLSTKYRQEHRYTLS